jgi:hypothetical protein
MPSEVAQPTRIDTLPQQGSTSPDDGQNVHTHDSEQVQAEGPGQKVPFAAQAIGYAQKTRGAVLGNSTLKEHGERILEGAADAREAPPKK